MRSRSILAMLLALGASLALATAALAGGWASVIMTDPPKDPAPGSVTTIDLEVKQHGLTPVSWPKLTVVATNTATGETVTVIAQPKGAEGHYVAQITFPSSGDWALAFESNDLVMNGSEKLTLAAAPGGAVAASEATSTAADTLPTTIGIGFALAALLGLIGAMALRARSRRQRPAGAG